MNDTCCCLRALQVLWRVLMATSHGNTHKCTSAVLLHAQDALEQVAETTHCFIT